MKILIYILLIIGVIIFGFSLSSCIFMLLWNWVVVDLFTAPIINFWESLAIVVLLSFVGSMFKIK